VVRGVVQTFAMIMIVITCAVVLCWFTALSLHAVHTQDAVSHNFIRRALFLLARRRRHSAPRLAIALKLSPVLDSLNERLGSAPWGAKTFSNLVQASAEVWDL
jgi:hypothetical protein